jgi:xanthine dehydrogenase accessory factor
MSAAEVLAMVDRLRTGRTPFVLATVVRAQRPTSAHPGDRALVLPDGTFEGFVGGSCAESAVRTHGLRLLAAGGSGLLRISPEPPGPEEGEGVISVGNPCLSGGALEIFLESMLPSPLVLVAGDSPVAESLVRVGVALEYEVRRGGDGEIPESTSAVVVAAHGRDDEPGVLRAALRAGVPYVALVASRRRGAAVLDALGLPAELTGRVSVPAGLDIGARSAPEIALAVYAELLSRRPRTVAEPPAGAAAARGCCAG